MRGGFLYLVAVTDWASRRVLSWRLSNSLDASFCVEALEEALARWGKPDIFNTDQGSQFTSADFVGVLKDAKVRISMDGRGRCLDNVFIERLWRSLKYEAVYLHELADGIEARQVIGEWIAFYNLERPHSSHQGKDPRRGLSRRQPRCDFRHSPPGRIGFSADSAVFHSPGDGGCGVINQGSTPWLCLETVQRTGTTSVLTLHSDRGAPMTSQGTAQLLARLGVNRSLGRPRVSDDNPYSEAQFKTLKYHPGFPDRFPNQDAAISYCRSFFPWYNNDDRHAGIAMLTPETVHYGQAQHVLEQRQNTLNDAWHRHPERFVGGEPTHQSLPQTVWINKPDDETTDMAH